MNTSGVLALESFDLYSIGWTVHLFRWQPASPSTDWPQEFFKKCQKLCKNKTHFNIFYLEIIFFWFFFTMKNTAEASSVVLAGETATYGYQHNI